MATINSFNQKKFSYKLKEKRVMQKSISMDKAASEIGISKATIHRVENGTNPDINTFIKICTWLEEPITSFITSDKETSK